MKPPALAPVRVGAGIILTLCLGSVHAADLQFVVETFVGGARSPASVDGTGTEARFNNPQGLVADSQGNIYVADANNHTLRKVTPGGVVTTPYGMARVQGTNDGVGAESRFFSPAGVAVDSADNLYVADLGNQAIRKITPAGVVTTLAGLPGTFGGTDGTGSAARFRAPAGVVADGAGNVFVAEYQNYTIRKVTPAGVVTILAGQARLNGTNDGTGGAARFYGPYGIALNGAGDLIVADALNHTIRKVTMAGVVTTLAGLAGSAGSEDGTTNTARFNTPYGVAVDSAGDIYVADSFNHTIRKLTPAGVVTTLAGVSEDQDQDGIPEGSWADGVGNLARFDRPYGIFRDSLGRIFVGDTRNHLIRRIEAQVPPPPIAISDPNLGVDGFSFNLAGQPGLEVTIEASSDFVNWEFAGSATLGDPVLFQDPGGPHPQRFYRARSP